MNLIDSIIAMSTILTFYILVIALLVIWLIFKFIRDVIYSIKLMRYTKRVERMIEKSEKHR